jgi:hypothetical protein
VDRYGYPAGAQKIDVNSFGVFVCFVTYQRLFLIASCHAFLARAKLPRNDVFSLYRLNSRDLLSFSGFISGDPAGVPTVLSGQLCIDTRKKSGHSDI